MSEQHRGRADLAEAHMVSLDRLADAIEALIDRIGRAASWLVLAVVLLLFIQTPLREFHFRSHIFANDMGQGHNFIAIALKPNGVDQSWDCQASQWERGDLHTAF